MNYNLISMGFSLIGGLTVGLIYNLTTQNIDNSVGLYATIILYIYAVYTFKLYKESKTKELLENVKFTR